MMKPSAPAVDDEPPPYSPPLHPTGFSEPVAHSYQPEGYSPYTYPQPQPYPVQPPPNVYTPLMNPAVYPPKYTADSNVTIQSNPLMYVGGCPICRVGVIETDYPCIAICCAILFFPFGFLCCLPLRQKRCTNCGCQFN